MERVPLERKVLNENDLIAARLRARFAEHDILCLNLISSPGSGKTSLLERTLESFGRGDRVAVLTGDIQTENDAKRLARFGFPVKQITTGGTCHLDARMIEKALLDWRLEDIDLLLIENVGNLVCPSSYDLGEAAKIVVLSVAEGEDKPLKYPSIFFKSELLVLNKTDL
ncbi:MAG: hydrogenase nickel incorporation protein HypB, partial [Candidatus Acidiferrales bacterium]